MTIDACVLDNKRHEFNEQLKQEADFGMWWSVGNAITTDSVVTIVFHSAVRAISHARENPNGIPNSPPPTEIITDSVKNCRTISRLRAPIDRRIPITPG